MRFQFEITRGRPAQAETTAIAKAAPPQNLQSALSRGWMRIYESFTGAWQRNIVVDRATVDTYHADFACKTLIARDIAKCRVKLMEYTQSAGVWKETVNSAYDPVLRKPNRYQTRNQFWENWLLSKLGRGNTYVLKQYNGSKKVEALYVLDPERCKPLVSPDGQVWYEMATDHLAGLQSDVVRVPASEIIHDRFNCLYHPLVGLPPVYASGLASVQGLSIQNNSAKFFQNGSQPSGILTAAGEIGDDDAARFKEDWVKNYTGDNAGKVAVLGGGLKYEPIAMTAVEGQLIEQLKWTAEVVCSTYHVPPYKIGVGAMPSYNNVQALNVEYYSQCLQSLIEDAESCLDEGLGIGYGTGLGVEFDIENLLRMDGVAQIEMLSKAVQGAIYSPNEARQLVGKMPVAGGDSPMIQEQNYSLAALAKRDAKDDPFASAAAPAPAASAGADDGDQSDNDNSPEALAATAQYAGWYMRDVLAEALR